MNQARAVRIIWSLDLELFSRPLALQLQSRRRRGPDRKRARTLGRAPTRPELGHNPRKALPVLIPAVRTVTHRYPNLAMRKPNKPSKGRVK